MGMVFQEYALFPWRTTIQNIEMGLEMMRIPKNERRSAAMEYIRAFGLDGFENRFPKALSGGMKQPDYESGDCADGRAVCLSGQSDPERSPELSDQGLGETKRYGPVRDAQCG